MASDNEPDRRAQGSSPPPTLATAPAVEPENRVRAELHSLVAILAYYADALILKSPSSLVAIAIQPLSFLFLVVVVSGGGLLTNAVVGAIVSFLVGVGLADLPLELTGMKRRSQFYELFRSLPIAGLTLALGIAIGQSLPGLLYGAGLLVVLVALEGLGPLAVGAILLVVAAVWVWAIVTGYVLGVWLEKPTLVQRVTNVAVVISTTLAPVYYPVELLPDVLEPIALLFPSASGAYLLRFAVGDVPFDPLAAVVLPTAILGTGVLAVRIRRA